jgi:hypothetical protein
MPDDATDADLEWLFQKQQVGGGGGLGLISLVDFRFLYEYRDRHKGGHARWNAKIEMSKALKFYRFALTKPAFNLYFEAKLHERNLDPDLYFGSELDVEENYRPWEVRMEQGVEPGYAGRGSRVCVTPRHLLTSFHTILIVEFGV